MWNLCRRTSSHVKTSICDFSFSLSPLFFPFIIHNTFSCSHQVFVLAEQERGWNTLCQETFKLCTACTTLASWWHINIRGHIQSMHTWPQSIIWSLFTDPKGTGSWAKPSVLCVYKPLQSTLWPDLLHQGTYPPKSHPKICKPREETV